MMRRRTRSAQQILNIETGRDISIRELAELVADMVGYEGEIVFDTTKPGGTPRKLLDVSRLESMGWRATTPLVDGIRQTLDAYQKATVPAGRQ